MKPKHLFLAIAMLFAACALWFARPWRAHALQNSSVDISFNTQEGSNSNPNSAASLPRASQAAPFRGPNGRRTPDHTLRPPEPNRRFTDFTPEQRVQFARQGHGPGG